MNFLTGGTSRNKPFVLMLIRVTIRIQEFNGIFNNSIGAVVKILLYHLPLRSFVVSDCIQILTVGFKMVCLIFVASHREITKVKAKLVLRKT